jgi:hypothetical protein
VPSVPFAVVVPVGPQPLEVERLVDLADALAAYEAGPGWLVIVDDGPVTRNLEHAVTLPAGITPVGLHHQHHHEPAKFSHGGGLCSQVMLAMQWVQQNCDARFVLKLDTDSLVINPFSHRLGRLIDADPLLGMVGAHTLTPNGTHRLWEHHAATIMRMANAPFDWRRPLQALRAVPSTEMGRLIAAALANGYDAALDRMARSGYLREPLGRWMHVDMAEDVMVGLHVRAVGMTLANFVRPGEVFGVRYQGLPESPSRLVEMGYSVIHSLKNDPGFDEPAIRRFFKRRRSASPPAKVA